MSLVNMIKGMRDRKETLSSFGISMNNETFVKGLILFCLTCQATSIALVTRYSKGILKQVFRIISVIITTIIKNEIIIIIIKKFSNNEIVFLSEVLKLCVSMIMIYRESGNKYGHRLMRLLLNSRNILLVVGLYSFINVLSFKTLELLNAAVYTILIQLKVLTTAFFGVCMLSELTTILSILLLPNFLLSIYYY